MMKYFLMKKGWTKFKKRLKKIRLIFYFILPGLTIHILLIIQSSYRYLANPGALVFMKNLSFI